MADDLWSTLRDADAIGLVTEWPEFTQLDWAKVRTVTRGSAIVDGRNALDPSAITAAGFRYTSFGRMSAPLRAPLDAELSRRRSANRRFDQSVLRTAVD